MKSNVSHGLHPRLAGLYVVSGVLTLVYLSHDLATISGLLLVGAGLLAWRLNGKTTGQSHRKTTSGQRAPRARPSTRRLRWE